MKSLLYAWDASKTRDPSYNSKRTLSQLATIYGHVNTIKLTLTPVAGTASYTINSLANYL